MRTTSLFLLSLAAAACDSGSGASATVVAPPVTVAPVLVIDPDNATDVLRVGFRAASDLRALFEEVLRIWAGRDPAELGDQTAVTETIPGPKTGTASFLWADRDGSKTYTLGDDFLLTFEDYSFGVLVLNGLMRLELTSRVGPFPEAGAWRVDGTIEALDLRVQVGARTAEVADVVRVLIQNPGAITKGYEIDFDTDFGFGDTTIQAGASILGNITSESTLSKFYLPLLSARLESALDVESDGWINWKPIAVELPDTGLLRIVGAEDTAVEVARLPDDPENGFQWIPGFPIPLPMFSWRGGMTLIEGEDVTESTIFDFDLIEL